MAGEPGSELTLSIELTGDIEISALQLTAELGAVASVIEGEAETVGRAASHSITAHSSADGRLQVLIYSTSMHTIAAGSGEIARIRLRAGAEAAVLQTPLTVTVSDASGCSVGTSGVSTLDIRVLAPRAEMPGGLVYDFGRVPVRGSYTLQVPVFNAGTVPLVISALNFSSGNCSVETDMPLTVAPGLSDMLTIAYAPMRRGAESSTVEVISNGAPEGKTVLRLLAEAYAVNEVRVGNVYGVCDSELTIPVTVKNMDAVSGFTFEFNLPQHLEYIDGSFKLNVNRRVDHDVAVSVEGRSLHATAYSLTDTPFAGNDGELATFAVRLNGPSEASVVPAKAILAAMVDGKLTDVTSAIYGGVVDISYPMMVVENSLSLGRSPVTACVSRDLTISNRGSAPLIVDRAIADGDIDIVLGSEFPLTVEPSCTHTLTVSHHGERAGNFSGRILLYNNDPDARLKPVAIGYDRYFPNEFSYQCVSDCSGGGVLQISLDNYTEVHGIQLSVHPHEAFTMGIPRAVGRAEGWSVEARQMPDGATRLFCFSLSGVSIPRGEGTVIELPYHYSSDIPTGDYQATADGYCLSDANLTDCSSALVPDNFVFTAFAPVVSGIEEVTGCKTSVRYFDLHGVEISPDAMCQGLYIELRNATGRLIRVK